MLCAYQHNDGVLFALPLGAQAGQVQIVDLSGRQLWSMNVAGSSASWNGVLENGEGRTVPFTR